MKIMLYVHCMNYTVWKSILSASTLKQWEYLLTNATAACSCTTDVQAGSS